MSAWTTHMIITLFEEPAFFKGKPWRYALIYVIPVITMIMTQYSFVSENYGLLYLFYFYIPFILMVLALLYAIYKFVYERYKSSDPLFRQRARLLILGYVFAATAATADMILMMFEVVFPNSLFIFPAIIPMPIAVAYSVLRHNLFEVDEFVKRSFIYISLVLFSAGFYGMLFWFSNIFLFRFAFYQNPLFLPVFLIAILYLLYFLKNPMQSYINQKFFRTKINMNKVAEEVKEELVVGLDKNKIIGYSDNLIRDTLQLTNIEILLENGKNDYSSINQELFVGKEDEIFRILQSENRLISHNEIMNDPKFEKVRTRSLAQMARVESEFLMPINFRNKMIGIIALGKKRSAEESFNLQDINALNYISTQVAVALENAGFYDSLKEAAEELSKLNIILEHKVKERTKELETRRKELIIANVQIAVATKNKVEFLANMSHELRTPINGILGFCALFLEGIYGEINQQTRTVLKDLYINGQDLLQLINNILDLSKIEAKKLKVTKEEFSVRDVVDAVANEMVKRAAEKKMRIIGEFQKGLPLAYGESQRVKQVLGILIGNAIRFSKCGKITIKIEKGRGIGQGINFSVVDDGIGIPKKRLKHIFEEHEIMEDTRIEEYKGVGLGLALSKKLIEMQGGEIFAEAEVGRGSKFEFSLPIEK